MSQRPLYTEYHPRWYRPRVSTYWWLHSWSYLKFILRELSSVPVVYFVWITMLQIHALKEGPQAYAELQEWLGSPVLVLLNAVSFLFILLHAITWFNLTPRAIVFRIRGKRVAESLIIAPNYVAWLMVSGAVAWMVLGG